MDIDELWWTVDDYLRQGISYAVFYEGEMVAWCTPDCVAGKRIDMGIMTHPAYRRRGLASIAASAWALLQNREKALVCLTAAVDHGWTNAAYTRRLEEFGILHDTPEWDLLLMRMEDD